MIALINARLVPWAKCQFATRVMGAGAGWHSTVPAGTVRLTVALLDGRERTVSVTAP
jgi:hypothetical protein